MKMPVSITRAQSLLISTFIIFFIIILVSILITFLKGELSSDYLFNLIKKILSVYSVPLSIILAGVFANSQRYSETRLSSNLPFWIAYIMTLIWNILLTWPCIFFALPVSQTTDPPPLNAQQLSDYLEFISSSSSFLTSGALAYFFAKEK